MSSPFTDKHSPNGFRSVSTNASKPQSELLSWKGKLVDSMAIRLAPLSALAAAPAFLLWTALPAAVVAVAALQGHLQEEAGVEDLVAEHPVEAAWGQEVRLLWPRAQVGQEVETGVAAEVQDGEGQNLLQEAPAALMAQPSLTTVLDQRDDDNAAPQWVMRDSQH